MRVLMISAEVETFARTGGLGDAVYGLSRALARAGHEVLVATPLYGSTHVPENARWWWDSVHARVGWGPDDVRRLGVLEVREDHGAGSVRFLLLANEPLYGGRRGIYGDSFGTFSDNDLRFATLSRGALDAAAMAFDGPENVDVVHAHDWHAALAPIYARGTMGERWARVRQVLTIHNLAYQGVLGMEAVDRLGIARAFVNGGILEHFGDVNLIKGAVALADAVVAVSKTYAQEIRRPAGGFGLDGVLRALGPRLHGIVNGIDFERCDPATDRALPMRYNAASHDAARRANKGMLAAELGLDQDDGPIFAMVSRLTAQKGADVLLPCVSSLVEQGARFALVGTGEPWLEQRLREAAWRFPGRVAARVAFDRDLAQRVYGGADFVVVPSRFEPCGLTQLYAMRYGAIPVVTGVGGLADTVEPANLALATGTGFVARRADAWELLIALEDALTAYRAPRALRALRVRAMSAAVSWDDAARGYEEVYRR